MLSFYSSLTTRSRTLNFGLSNLSRTTFLEHGATFDPRPFRPCKCSKTPRSKFLFGLKVRGNLRNSPQNTPLCFTHVFKLSIHRGGTVCTRHKTVPLNHGLPPGTVSRVGYIKTILFSLSGGIQTPLRTSSSHRA